MFTRTNYDCALVRAKSTNVFEVEAINFTPKVLMSICKTIETKSGGFRVTDLAFSSSPTWHLFVGSDQFFRAIDPAPSAEVLKSGNIGMLFGMSLWTDGFIHPADQFMEKSSVLFLALNQGEVRSAALLKILDNPHGLKTLSDAY